MSDSITKTESAQCSHQRKVTKSALKLQLSSEKSSGDTSFLYILCKCSTMLKGKTAMRICMNNLINDVEKYFLNHKTLKHFYEEIKVLILSVTYANPLHPN